MALDRQIDELFQLPLGEFTAARNALAKTLSGADASRVKRLEKPTVVPWAANQLFWRDRRVYDRLMKSGGELRTAQIAALEGKKADVRRAGETHRKALAEAVERAIALAAAHGAKPGPEPLSRMLEALSISASAVEHPGRLTDLVQPAGFEALTGVTPKAVPAPAAATSKRAEAAPKGGPAPKRAEVIQIDREARRADAERREKEAKIAAATRNLERARAAESQARRALQRAEEEVRAAEAALETAKR